MSSKLLINAIDHEECRIAKVKESKTRPEKSENLPQVLTENNRWYQVRRGDNLESIALRHKITINELMVLNNIKDKNLFEVFLDEFETMWKHAINWPTEK